jgi:nitroreductase
MVDKFQKNYLRHQEYKKLTLTGKIKEPKLIGYTREEKKAVIKVIKKRRSRRIYNRGVNISSILKIAGYAPSSCARRGVEAKKLPIYMMNALIGAREWHKKGSVIGLYANPVAYKSEWEKEYMPYLDAGVMAQTILIYCEVKGYKACFINPNTHGKYKGKKIFCGAIAIGK